LAAEIGPMVVPHGESFLAMNFYKGTFTLSAIY